MYEAQENKIECFEFLVSERLTADVDQSLDGEIGMPAAEVAQLRRDFPIGPSGRSGVSLLPVGFYGSA
jgi:hypothetical protein